MATDMAVHLVGDMEVEKVAFKVADMVADMFAAMVGGTQFGMIMFLLIFCEIFLKKRGNDCKEKMIKLVNLDSRF